MDLAVNYANQVAGYALEAIFLDNWDKNNKYERTIGNYSMGSQRIRVSGKKSTVRQMVTTIIEVPKDQVSSYGTHVYFKIPRFQKYVDPSSPQTSAYNRELNASILRYADILLIKAEAINERDQASCRAWICIPFAVLRGRVLLSGFTGITGNISKLPADVPVNAKECKICHAGKAE